MTLEELSDMTGVSGRNIRYYIAQGLLPGPTTMGRKASYTDDHVNRLRQIQTWQAEGKSLAEIKTLGNSIPPCLGVVHPWKVWTLPSHPGFTVWEEHPLTTDLRIQIGTGITVARRAVVMTTLTALKVTLDKMGDGDATDK